MNTLVKTSWDFENVDAQVLNPSSLEYEKLLEGVGQGFFMIPVDDPQLPKFVDGKKIEVCEVVGGEDKTVFTGIVSLVEYDFYNAKVTFDNEKAWLKKKILYSGYDTTEDFTAFLGTVLAAMNARRNTAVENEIALETSLSSSANFKFDKTDTYYNVMDGVASKINAEWDLVKNKLIFKEKIGEDRTTGENAYELSSSTTSPNENNMANAKYTKNIDERANAIIGKSGTVYENAENIDADIPRFEKGISYDEGDLADQVANDLVKRKEQQTEIDVEPLETRDKEAFALGVGDSITIRVSRGNDMLDTIDTVRVIGKKVEMKNTNPFVTLAVATTARKKADSVSFFSKIVTDIYKLQIGA